VLPESVALRARRVWLSRRVLNGRAYKEGDVDLLPQLLKPSDVCWDIGANSGMYTVPMARLAAQVCAFEPVPHNFDILEAVIKRGRLKNVVPRRLAISDSNGIARMAIPVTGFYGGYYMAALDEHGALEVRSVTIDGLIAEGVPEPDFIKCDVEGAEDRVVNGARRLIARRHPVWLLETFEDSMLTLMASLGYAAYVNDERRGLVMVTARTNARNYLFIRAGDRNRPRPFPAA
jgi:FkbM family methyltransferase